MRTFGGLLYPFYTPEKALAFLKAYELRDLSLEEIIERSRLIGP